jgi:ABC-type branched-subunit amino acid transport system ATPase component
MLKIENMQVQYGQSTILREVNLTVPAKRHG